MPRHPRLFLPYAIYHVYCRVARNYKGQYSAGETAEVTGEHLCGVSARMVHQRYGRPVRYRHARIALAIRFLRADQNVTRARIPNTHRSVSLGFSAGSRIYWMFGVTARFDVTWKR